MEAIGSQGFRPETMPSTSESVVLDAKPLRCLAPMPPSPLMYNPFSGSNTLPFFCFPPFGPYPPGVPPFPPGVSPIPPGVSPTYPAFVRPVAQRAPEQATDTVKETSNIAKAANLPLATQLPSFGTEPSGETANGEGGASKGVDHEPDFNLRSKKTTVGKPKRPLSKIQVCHRACSTIERNGKRSVQLSSCRLCSETHTTEKKHKHKPSKKAKKSTAVLSSSLSNNVMFSEDSRESVERILRMYDAVRRRFLQLEDGMKEAPGKSFTKRPDLKAGASMMTKGFRVNMEKRIGAVPGINVGDLFYFRMEMCLVGLHAPCMGGIDYMIVRFDGKEEPLATSIVSSGGYEDDVDDGETLIYSGQGGNNYMKGRKQIDDQKLERGNLALERSMSRGNEIRVIRGKKDLMNPSGKTYIYDGLYKIQESWIDKGKSGFSVFKYKLLRIPDQPNLGTALWKSTEQWKANPSSRGGVILPDISSGIENLPVCLVNDVDNDKGPAHFFYVTRIRYLKSISMMKPYLGCKCHNNCAPTDAECCCIQQNGGDSLYSSNGILVSSMPMIYECGASCMCSPNCRNKVSQKGVRIHFEVFKTSSRGWGLRSWDPIRAGSFICEYTGEVIERNCAEDEDLDDEYTFDGTRAVENSFQWHTAIELLGEPPLAKSNGSFNPVPITISAKKMGNISRFMNHSCSPNVFWQPVLYDHNDDSFPHIMFFALKHIPPLIELTYDYGVSGVKLGKEQLGGADGSSQRKKCLCGSSECRDFFG